MRIYGWFFNKKTTETFYPDLKGEVFTLNKRNSLL
jgi:hypothetical protein